MQANRSAVTGRWRILSLALVMILGLGGACKSEDEGDFVQGLAATETDDAVFGVVAAHENGETMAAMTARDETGAMVGVTGVVWMSADKQHSAVIQMEDGMPSRAVVGDAVLFFREWTATSVDVTVVSADGVVTNVSGAEIDEDYIRALRDIDTIATRDSSLKKSALFGGKLSLLKAVKVAGLAVGAVGCALAVKAVAAASAGTLAYPAAVAGLKCGGVLVGIAINLFPESDKLKTTGALIDGALCGLAFSNCEGVAQNLLEQQVEHAEAANDTAMNEAGNKLDPAVCKPFCDGRQCGSDWCGGTCGSCGSGSECVRTTGQCRQTSQPDAGVSASDSGTSPRDAGTPPMTGGYVRIPAGTFTMGSPSSEPGRDSDEGPQHQVTISQAFWLKATEVTQDEWQSVMGSNPSRFSSCGGSCPVEQVSWLQAIDYLNRLSQSEGLQVCYPNGDGSGFVGLSCTGYRLPTEAEWEYAARAGTTTAYWSGTSESDLARAGWYSGNSGSTTHPVGQKQANAWGLYDVHGNVWEWVHDWYGSYGAGSATNPTGATAGPARVIRGGSWYRGAQYCRSASRSRFRPDNRAFNLGFRSARSIP